MRPVCVGSERKAVGSCKARERNKLGQMWIPDAGLTLALAAEAQTGALHSIWEPVRAAQSLKSSVHFSPCTVTNDMAETDA